MNEAERDGRHAYTCFGLHIQSALPLPEISPFVEPADPARPPDAEFVFGTIDATGFDMPPRQGLRVDRNTALLTIKDVARYLIREGRQIIIDPVPSASTRSIRLFLLGSAFGVLCHQRGLLPLHANAIVVNGSAVAFAGHSGAGKSTLAAHFQHAGYDVLCDDVCVLSFAEGGRPLAWPGLPRLKLWREAADNFGHDSTRLERAVDGLEKYHVPFSRPPAPGPFALKRLYLLESNPSGTASPITRLSGTAAYQAVVEHTYRRQYIRPLGLSQRHFQHCVALLNHIEVYRAPRHWGYDVFEAEAEKFARHVAEE